MNRFKSVAFGLLVLMAASLPVEACSVCGGDKNSDMVKGALSGVVVMVCITYGVLMGFAGVIASFVVRARRLARIEEAGKSDGDSASS